MQNPKIKMYVYYAVTSILLSFRGIPSIFIGEN
jgi:hypothetical protein